MSLTYPRKGYTVLCKPTSHATPSLFHPLLFTNSVKTNSELFFFEVTPRAMTIATKAATWIMPRNVSAPFEAEIVVQKNAFSLPEAVFICGSNLMPNVFMAIA